MVDLANPTQIKMLLARHGFHFSKALGQNFLINPSVCPRMAAQCGAEEAAGVLEIGPGIGVLTAELSHHAQKVVALELDHRLLPVLDETLADCPHVKVIQADAMEADLAALLAQEFDGPVAVCANLPYYITSPLLMRLLESRLPITAVTVMVQKEAATRICAVPGSRDAGAISLAVRYYAEPRVLFDVSAGSFLPRPHVDSCVIRLDLHSTPPVAVQDEKKMFRVVRAAFGQRRKTLLNALSAGLGLPKVQIGAALRAVDIAENLRGERLTLEDFARLSDALTAAGKSVESGRGV